MMQTIIDLWDGNIAPSEHCGARDGEADHLLSLMESNRERLCEGLAGKQKEFLEKYIDCSEEYLCRMLKLAFSEGFCLGSKLTMEAVTGC